MRKFVSLSILLLTLAGNSFAQEGNVVKRVVSIDPKTGIKTIREVVKKDTARANKVVTNPTKTAANKFYFQPSIYGFQLSDQDITFNYTTPPAPSVDGVFGYDFDLGFGLVLGTNVSETTSFELEYALRTSTYSDAVIAGTLVAIASSEDSTFDSSAFMVNAKFRTPSEGKINPYFGVGIGYANLTDGELDTDALAYQGMVGFEAPSRSGKGAFVVGYKYFATEEASFDINQAGLVGSIDFDYETHNLELGYKFNF